MKQQGNIGIGREPARLVARRVLRVVLWGVACLPLAGCKQSSVPGGELFVPEQDARDVDRATAAQAAAGARADAMLYARHFEGARLNSLGRSKLHLMLVDRPEDQPLVVYLNLAAGSARADDREKSVERYLQDAGLAAGEIQVRMGPNPDAFTPAQPGLARLPKTESSAGGEQGSYGASAETATRNQPIISK